MYLLQLILVLLNIHLLIFSIPLTYSFLIVRDLISFNYYSLDKMISKFLIGIARSSGTTIACGKRSFIIGTSVRQGRSRSRGFGIRVHFGIRDERRALTIAGRRDWNWESSGQPRPHRLESRNTGYKLGNRFLSGIYIANVSPPRNEELSTE